MRYTFRDPPMPLVSLERVLDAEPPNERKFNSGNKRWLVTMAPGSYEISDTPDADGMLSVHRVDDNGRELVLKLPAADFYAEDDEAGCHIFVVPENANASSLLNGETSDAAIPNRRTGEMVQLHRLNAFHRARAWDREPATHPKTSEATPLLARMNAANRRFYSGGDDAA